MTNGEYLDFSFNDKKISDYGGIVRVSGGNRYKMDLLPPQTDRVVSVPGQHGAYYFGSEYGPTTLNLAIAFDKLTVKDVSDLQRLFAQSQTGELIFQEAPYKVYKGKITGGSIEYLPFEKEEVGKGGDIYKGEGQLQFTMFYPFAKSRYKSLHSYKAEYSDDKIENWVAASGLIDLSVSPNQDYDKVSSRNIPVYNPGHFPVDFLLYFDFHPTLLKNTLSKISLNTGPSLEFMGFDRKGVDKGFVVNTKNFTIEGYVGTIGGIDFKLTGNLYNDRITRGNFFKIPIQKEVVPPQTVILSLEPTTTLAEKIEYDYLYL